jgi:hypothetical protein
MELKGYCIHTKMRFHVHEFVENGSLAETLFGNILNSITKPKKLKTLDRFWDTIKSATC